MLLENHFLRWPTEPNNPHSQMPVTLCPSLDLLISHEFLRVTEVPSRGTFPCTWGSARLLGSVISCIRVTGMQYEVKAFNPDGSGTLLWAYCKGPTGPRYWVC